MAVNRAVSSHLPWLIVNQSGTTSREAWEYGPVVAVLYRDLKRNGADIASDKIRKRA